MIGKKASLYVCLMYPKLSFKPCALSPVLWTWGHCIQLAPLGLLRIWLRPELPTLQTRNWSSWLTLGRRCVSLVFHNLHLCAASMPSVAWVAVATCQMCGRERERERGRMSCTPACDPFPVYCSGGRGSSGCKVVAGDWAAPCRVCGRHTRTCCDLAGNTHVVTWLVTTGTS